MKRMTGAFVGALVALSAASFAGPLDPPAGPITSTNGVLEQRTIVNATNTPGDADSVFRISAPGSYYLDRSYAFAAAQINLRHAIEIDSDDVTLDLNGFSLRGAGTCRMAIFVNGVQENITIRNGSMITWNLGGIVGASADQASVIEIGCDSVSNAAPGGPAIQLRDNAVVRHCRVEVILNAQPGISVGASSTVSDCTVAGTTAGGIVINGLGSTVRNVLVSGTTGIGIGSGANSVSLQDCTVRTSSGAGVNVGADSVMTRIQSLNNTGAGIVAGGCSTISESVANNNGGLGISVGAHSKVIACSACINSGNGIVTGNRCVITTCTANLNTSNGFATGTGCVVSNSTAADNTVDGFDLGQENTVSTCTAAGNDQDGFDLNDSGRIYGCTASGNNVHGIRVSDDTLVRENNCEANGVGSGVTDGSGIFVPGNDNRIDSNSVIENDVGVNAGSSTGSNLIIRNSASGNTTNFDVGANNAAGAIFVIAPGGTITTGNSYANFEY